MIFFLPPPFLPLPSRTPLPPLSVSARHSCSCLWFLLTSLSVSIDSLRVKPQWKLKWIRGLGWWRWIGLVGCKIKSIQQLCEEWQLYLFSRVFQPFLQRVYWNERQIVGIFLRKPTLQIRIIMLWDGRGRSLARRFWGEEVSASQLSCC